VTLDEIREWLEHGSHVDGSRPDCWVDEALAWCVSRIEVLEAREGWCWQRGMLTECTLLRLEHLLADDYISLPDSESKEDDT
jgi:hypothetical protein